MGKAKEIPRRAGAGATSLEILAWLQAASLVRAQDKVVEGATPEEGPNPTDIR